MKISLFKKIIFFALLFTGSIQLSAINNQQSNQNEILETEQTRQIIRAQAQPLLLFDFNCFKPYDLPYKHGVTVVIK